MTEINKWGQLDLTNWSDTPFISDRIAAEQDVIDGCAVFYIQDSVEKHCSLNITLPSLAYQVDPDTNKKTLAVVIQAENVDGEEVVGVRYLEGGNGICKLSELEFVDNL